MGAGYRATASSAGCVRNAHYVSFLREHLHRSLQALRHDSTATPPHRIREVFDAAGASKPHKSQGRRIGIENRFRTFATVSECSLPFGLLVLGLCKVEHVKIRVTETRF